ncbi:hypothetical protein IW262DRAFT_1464292 [Armillaria fumosa]|nr:hypothetical protein IW262DRAFT_1464292 [Armillaria fumosa]
MSPFQSLIDLPPTPVILFSMPPKDITLCRKYIRDGIQIRDDAHAESIRRTPDGVQLKLCEYDMTMEALEDALANLKKRRAGLAHSIQVYKSYFAPIFRLPVELPSKSSRKHVPFLLAKPYPKPSSHLPRPRSLLPQFALTGEVFAYLFRNSGPSCLLTLTTSICLRFVDVNQNFTFIKRMSSKLTTTGISAQFLQKYRYTIGTDDDDDIPPYMSLKTLLPPLISLINPSSCQSLMLGTGLVEKLEFALPVPTFASFERWYLSGSIITENIVFSHSFSDTPRLRELHLHDTLFFDFDLTGISSIYYGSKIFYGEPFGDMMTNTTISGIKVLQIYSQFSAGFLDVLTLPDLPPLELMDDETGDSHHITSYPNFDKKSLLWNLVVIRDEFSITERHLKHMMDTSGFSTKLGDFELVWAEDNVIEEETVLNVATSRRGPLQSVSMGMPGGGEVDT